MPSGCRMAASTSSCRAWSASGCTKKTARASTVWASSNGWAETSRHRPTPRRFVVCATIEHLLVPLVERGSELTVPPTMTDADVIHALAQYLDLAVIEKQALLECDTLVSRATALADLLEMKAMTAGKRAPTSTH